MRGRMSRGPWSAFVGISCLVLSAASASADVDHSSWDQLLAKHVNNGQVDYQGVQADRAQLDGYLNQLATVDVGQLASKEAKLALWINAYNACVFKGVLDHAPLESVKDVPGFFDRARYRVANESLTLNEIEGKGRALGDWRIHFAVVCASTSCPPLIGEAYVADRLDAQLTERTKAFLADHERGLCVEGATLCTSQIFKWYARDFLPSAGWLQPLTVEKLLGVLSPYLPAELAQADRRSLAMKFLDYDWRLNAQQGRGPR